MTEEIETVTEIMIEAGMIETAAETEIGTEIGTAIVIQGIDTTMMTDEDTVTSLRGALMCISQLKISGTEMIEIIAKNADPIREKQISKHF